MRSFSELRSIARAALDEGDESFLALRDFERTFTPEVVLHLIAVIEQMNSQSAKLNDEFEHTQDLESVARKWKTFPGPETLNEIRKTIALHAAAAAVLAESDAWDALGDALQMSSDNMTAAEYRKALIDAVASHASA